MMDANRTSRDGIELAVHMRMHSARACFVSVRPYRLTTQDALVTDSCVCVVAGQKDMPPEEVTALKEDVLRGRVALLANDPTAAQQEKLVSFMTFGLLSRLQAAVYDVTKNEQLSLPRQSLQALVMASMTGVRTAIGRQEAEYIGNAIDYQLRNFHKELSKAKDAARKRAARAIQAGEKPE